MNLGWKKYVPSYTLIYRHIPSYTVIYRHIPSHTSKKYILVYTGMYFHKNHILVCTCIYFLKISKKVCTSTYLYILFTCFSYHSTVRTGTYRYVPVHTTVRDSRCFEDLANPRLGPSNRISNLQRINSRNLRIWTFRL